MPTPTPPLALPALPRAHSRVPVGDGAEDRFTADQMNAYATAAILSDRAGRGDAAPVAQPPAIAEAVARSKHLAWLRDQTDHWIGNRKARRDEALAALATQPPAPVQQTEAVAWSYTDMTLWRATVEMLVDVYFDGVENAPGGGSYVSGTLDQAMSESRALLKRTPPAPAAALPPVARVTLDKKQIDALWRQWVGAGRANYSFVRAIIEASTGEQSHG